VSTPEWLRNRTGCSGIAALKTALKFRLCR
jgi:hypothetical protein